MNLDIMCFNFKLILSALLKHKSKENVHPLFCNKKTKNNYALLNAYTMKYETIYEYKLHDPGHPSF